MRPIYGFVRPTKTITCRTCGAPVQTKSRTRAFCDVCKKDRRAKQVAAAKQRRKAKQ